MKSTFICVILIGLILAIILTQYNNKKESYWPYSIYSGGHYFQGPMTFNNNDRYFDMSPYLGVYRNVDFGTWGKNKKL